MDAADALFELRVHGGPQTIAFTARRQHALTAPEPSALVPQEQTSTSEMATMTAATDAIAELRMRHRSGTSRTSSARDPASAGWDGSWPPRWRWWRPPKASHSYDCRRRARQRPPRTRPIVLDSMVPGDAVIVNGQQVGVTPMTLTLSPDVRSIAVQTRAPEATAPIGLPAVVPAAESAPNPAAAANAVALASARERRGGLRIVSPVEVQVLEGERVLGSTADGPIVTTAGRHELDFINSAVGYRSRQVVDIKAGQIVRMTVTMPDGRVSINAVPWAQVLINGNSVGDTPLANLSLPAGEHQITFRHPQLGEQTQRVMVKSGALTRVSADAGRVDEFEVAQPLRAANHAGLKPCATCCKISTPTPGESQGHPRDTSSAR
jgi:hypothetical protein